MNLTRAAVRSGIIVDVDNIDGNTSQDQQLAIEPVVVDYVTKYGASAMGSFRIKHEVVGTGNTTILLSDGGIIPNASSVATVNQSPGGSVDGTYLSVSDLLYVIIKNNGTGLATITCGALFGDSVVLASGGELIVGFGANPVTLAGSSENLVIDTTIGADVSVIYLGK